MGEWIKRVVLLACVAAALWRGWAYWRARDAQHQFVFRVEGPVSCRVEMRWEAGAVPGREESTLEWQSEPVTARGTESVSLTVDVPLTCGWQPEQVRCFVLRDGAPWKDATARRLNDPSNGNLVGYRCEVSGEGWR